MIDSAYASPNALKAVGAILRARLGEAAGALPDTPPSQDPVWQIVRRLGACETDEALRRAAEGMRRSDACRLLGCLSSLVEQPVVARRVVRAVGYAHPKEVAREAMTLLSHYFDLPFTLEVANIWRGAMDAQTEVFWRVVAAAGASKDPRRLGTLFRGGATWRTLSTEHNLSGDSPDGLARVLMAANVLHASADLLRQNRPDVEEAVARVKDAALPRILDRYCEVFGVEQIETIAPIVKARMGRPSTSGDPRWREVKPETHEAFETRFKLEELHSFFSGDNERFVYWRKHVKTIKHVAAKLDNRVLFMDFGSFGVVEFAKTNNAAYFYDASMFRALLNSHGRTEGDFKRKDGGRLGRLSHNPPSSWQPKFDRKLRRLRSDGGQ